MAPVGSDFTCIPLAVTSQIKTTNKLLVYTAHNNLWPNTHAFNLTSDDAETMLTTTCTDNNGYTFSYPFAKFLYVFVGGNCLPSITPQTVPFTDAAQLSGTYNSPNGFGKNATWSFTLQYSNPENSDWMAEGSPQGSIGSIDFH